ncbi:hypothetical protein [Enterococcus mediterraneensis]|nr:hypothetical protein [Enterococcus mediterraneensis]
MSLIDASVITFVAMFLVFFILAVLWGALVAFNHLMKEMTDD